MQSSVEVSGLVESRSLMEELKSGLCLDCIFLAFDPMVIVESPIYFMILMTCCMT